MAIEQITWRASLEEARVEAREQHKDLIVHLDNPGRDGCGAMRAITYHDPRVIEFITEIAVPVMFNTIEDPSAQVRFHSFWTPTVMLFDVDGNEHRRTYGCLDAPCFLAEFSLGLALRFLHTGHFKKSLELLEEALEHTSPEPSTHAENYYWLGVARYRVSGIAHDLESAWRTLRHDYPECSWARRTDFYFQLQDGV